MLVRTPSSARSSRAAIARSIASARVRAVNDELCEHRVEIGRHLLPGVERVLETEIGRRGHVEIADVAGFRHEVPRRVFRADSAFDRVAPADRAALPERQPMPGGNIQLHAHEIEAGDHLGDGMLDLKPRVHLQEEEATVGAENEFDRADIAVLRRRRQTDSGGADLSRAGSRTRFAAGASSTIF